MPGDETLAERAANAYNADSRRGSAPGESGLPTADWNPPMPTATPAGKTATKPAAAKTDKPVAKPAAAAAKPAAKAAAPAKPEKVVAKPAKAAEKPAPAPVVPPVVVEKPLAKNLVMMDFDAFLAKLTPKDRLNIERHLAAIEEQSTKAHAKLWKKLATQMMTMASHSAKANGQQSMQFYIQDGKYRMQIFALEDLRDGTVHVYATDAADEALKEGFIKKPKPADEADQYGLAGTTDLLILERLDGKVSNPAPFYKDMLGWNRRAIHIALPAMASDVQIAAVEKLLLLGAKKAGAVR